MTAPTPPGAGSVRLSILQVSPSAVGGGAEGVARALHAGFLSRGHDAWLAVGRLPDPPERIIRIAGRHGPWASRWWRLHQRLSDERRSRAALAVRAFVTPGALVDNLRGREDFRFPDTHSLLDLTPDTPDIVQLHNLHGGYFDLRELPHLSRAADVVLTPHDAWLTTGHVAHSLDCDRWQTGCGDCPYLSLYPAIRRDDSHENWARKKAIFAASRVRVATPSHWLMDRLEQSILAPAIVEQRVIPYGIDLDQFTPGSRRDARLKLGLPEATPILVMSARSLRTNPWKDFGVLRAALSALGANVLVLALGDVGVTEFAGGAEIRFLPDVPSTGVADYLRAADLYVHPARADTFPVSVLEALASGIPVVATRVGGIVEQVKHERTGLLVGEGDAEGFAAALGLLLNDEQLRRAYGEAAASDARLRFDAADQLSAYLEWYAEIAERRSRSLPNRPQVNSAFVARRDD